MFGVTGKENTSIERCGWCGKTPAEITDRKVTKLLVCGGCKIEKYCGRACQKGDWSTHRLVCDFKPNEQAPPKETVLPNDPEKEKARRQINELGAALGFPPIGKSHQPSANTFGDIMAIITLVESTIGI